MQGQAPQRWGGKQRKRDEEAEGVGRGGCGLRVAATERRGRGGFAPLLSLPAPLLYPGAMLTVGLCTRLQVFQYAFLAPSSHTCAVRWYIACCKQCFGCGTCWSGRHRGATGTDGTWIGRRGERLAPTVRSNTLFLFLFVCFAAPVAWRALLSDDRAPAAPAEGSKTGAREVFKTGRKRKKMSLGELEVRGFATPNRRKVPTSL